MVLVHSTRSRLLTLLMGMCWAATSCVVLGQAVAVPDVAKIEGFEVQKLFDVPNDQGSWVSLTVDTKGRLIASDQYGGLYRVTVAAKDGQTIIEPIDVKTGRAHGLLYAFGALYVMSHEGDNQPSGLYRVSDTDGDDKFDKVELLRKIEGSGEHGPHAIVLSPDKKSLYVCAGNHTKLPEIVGSRVPQNWQEDQVVPRMWDANGHAAGILAPGGWICKVDRDGKEFELISMGYRNEYDIAFDPNGELFTYDADMEWDIGLPWYRPTRICQAIPGSEFGWRSGTGKWPAYWSDSLPPVVDIGPASPTGISFGSGTKFPAKYQNALFAADWSYGAIHAIHMEPNGAGLVGSSEVFATAPGLAVTDMTVNPIDGALYFLIGGRRSQSAMFRVTYGGKDSTAATTFPIPSDLAQQRRLLEMLLQAPAEEADSVVERALPFLSHTDRFIRYTARVAIERMPFEKWSAKVQAITDTQGTLEGAMAIARCGADESATAACKRLLELNWDALSEFQKLHWLRDVGLLWARHSESVKPQIEAIASRLINDFPNTSKVQNVEISRLLCGLNAKGTVPKVMELLRTAESQEEQIHYAFCLRVATNDWTEDLRKEYFQWFVDAGKFRGGNSFAKFLANTRAEAVERLPDDVRASLGELLTAAPASMVPNIELEERALVKNWKMDDWQALSDASLEDRDLENGRKMFAVGQCYKCHRLEGAGGSVGPDLTNAGRRFNPNDLLETLIVPSKEVSDQYQATIFQLDNGQTISGRIANLAGNNYMVQTDMYDPGRFTNIDAKTIEEMKPSAVSMMPTGLLDSMTQEDVLDLLSYLRSVSESSAPNQ